MIIGLTSGDNMGDGPLATRTLPTGQKAEVISLTYGRARICVISPTCNMSYDDSW
jgi:hypothetical protein